MTDVTAAITESWGGRRAGVVYSLDEYQSLAMKTSGGFEDSRTFNKEELMLICGAMGLCGESGEFTDAIKKLIFHRKPIPDEILAKELGDTLWYAALICKAKGWKLSEVASGNIDKLDRRYPLGFTFEAANAPRPGDVPPNAT